MATEYSYNDIMNMQEKAADSVREMHNRSAFSDNNDNEKAHISDFAKEKMQENHPQFSCRFEKCDGCETCPKRKEGVFQKKSDCSNGGLLSSLGLDDDKCLLLVLMLFMSKNSDDKLLLFALMYIMM